MSKRKSEASDLATDRDLYFPVGAEENPRANSGSELYKRIRIMESIRIGISGTNSGGTAPLICRERIDGAVTAATGKRPW